MQFVNSEVTLVYNTVCVLGKRVHISLIVCYHTIHSPKAPVPLCYSLLGACHALLPPHYHSGDSVLQLETKGLLGFSLVFTLALHTPHRRESWYLYFSFWLHVLAFLPFLPMLSQMSRCHHFYHNSVVFHHACITNPSPAIHCWCSSCLCILLLVNSATKTKECIFGF